MPPLACSHGRNQYAPKFGLNIISYLQEGVKHGAVGKVSESRGLFLV